MTRIALTALMSHWVRNWLQLAMLLAGLALATALWSGVQALNSEARSAYATAESLLAEGTAERLDHPSGQIAQDRYITLRRAGWQVSPVVEGRHTLGSARVTLVGIEPLTAPQGAGPALAAQDLNAFFAGRAFAHPQTITEIGAHDLDLHPSDAVPVGTVLLDIGRAQEMLDTEALSYLHLLQTQPAGMRPLDTLAPDLRRVPAGEGAELGGLTDSFHLNLTAFGLLAFAVGLFIVHSSVGLAFEQRRAMFRTLRALGLPLRTLTACLAAEMLVFALIAGVVGLVLGHLLASFLMPDVALTLRGLYGAPVPGVLQFNPIWAASGLAMTLGGAALAGAQALWRLWHLPILAPAQPRAWARASARGMRLQGGGALALAVLAIALTLGGDGLLTGFGLLAAALLAAALAVPLVLAALLRLAQRGARGPVAEWFWADSRQNMPRLSLALMALMLALAANIGVGTMVASFRATFIDWLDLRLAAELNVMPASAQEAAALHPYLSDRADAVLPMMRVDATLKGQPGQIYAMKDHASFRDNWPLIDPVPDAWDRLAAGEGVLVNEQLYRRAGLQSGADTLDLPGVGALPVLGAYADYGNPLAQAVLTLPQFQAAYPDAPVRQFAIRTSDAAGLTASLQEEFGLSSAQITDQAHARDLSMSIFERTFVITRALNVLTLSVAALALFAALVTLAGMRLAQLAPLWALGLTARRLAGLELARALVLGALTMVLALPVGLMLAQVLLSVINVQAFGWRLPLQVFPADWARLALWAMLAVLAAASLPALQLARQGPADLLRVFSRDR